MKPRQRLIVSATLGALVGLAGCQSDWPRLEPNPWTGPAAVPVARLGVPVAGEDAPPALQQTTLATPTESPVQPPSVVPAGGPDSPIDLETALRLGGAANPTIALAREAVQVSLAEQLRANALMLPTLDAGANFNLHRGNLLSAGGVIRDVNRQSLYFGAGAGALGASTVGVPGVRLTAHLADALFEPLAARQAVTARRFDEAATRNDILLGVALRYFDLAGAGARLAMIRQSESDLAVVVNLTAKFAAKGQGREADAQRAQAEGELLQGVRHRVEEEAAVAAAELARLLDLDPSVRLRPPEGPLPVIQLVDPASELEPLVQQALAHHPELQARTADVAVTATRLRKERLRPWVPLLAVGFSAGGFGGGSNQVGYRLGNFGDRTDFDVMAVWTLNNLGLGNRAVQRRDQARVDEALAGQALVANEVRRVVAEALALCAARLREVEIARTRLATAEQAYRQDLARTRNLEGRPIEVLNSVNLLTAARLDLIRAQVGYNQAQFRLFVALGQPPGGVGGQGCTSAP